MAVLIHGGDVITPLTVIRDGAVLIEGRRISQVGHSGALRCDRAITERVDAGGRLIAPGFIDLQLNGADGRLLTSEPSVAAVLAMAAVLPQFGCTAVLPTAITAPVDRLIAACGAVASAREVPSRGSTILGIHLEGPFINPERAGAHQTSFIAAPSEQVLRRLWHASDQSIRLITLAPEMARADDVITAARNLGITVAIGHTSATPAQVNEAVEHGASMATHLFNAMAPFGSRAPGTVGGTLANDNLFVSVIADGVHVHPVSLKVAVRAAGVDRVVLVTDAMPPVGSTCTTFQLDDQLIEVREGACYRSDGVLAGSVLTMDKAVKNMHRLVGVPLVDSIAMASMNPARVIGIANRKGSIEPGKDADILIVDPDVNIWFTMVEGQIRYRRSEIPGD